MKQSKQSKPQMNVLLVMNDTVLATSIEGILSRKRRLHINRVSPECLDLEEEIENTKPKVIILNPMAFSMQSPECLISMLSDPDVMKVLIVNPENNLVQIFKKQKITLVSKQNFSNLF